MSEGEKRRAMILVCLVAVIVVIIAANLRQLEFQPGMSFPELVKGDVVAAPLHNEPVVVMYANEFVKMLLSVTLLRAMPILNARPLWSLGKIVTPNFEVGHAILGSFSEFERM